MRATALTLSLVALVLACEVDDDPAFDAPGEGVLEEEGPRPHPAREVAGAEGLALEAPPGDRLRLTVIGEDGELTAPDAQLVVGQPVELRFVNREDVSQALAIEQLGLETAVVSPGGTAIVQFTPAAGGELELSTEEAATRLTVSEP